MASKRHYQYSAPPPLALLSKGRQGRRTIVQKCLPPCEKAPCRTLSGSTVPSTPAACSLPSFDQPVPDDPLPPVLRSPPVKEFRKSIARRRQCKSVGKLHPTNASFVGSLSCWEGPRRSVGGGTGLSSSGMRRGTADSTTATPGSVSGDGSPLPRGYVSCQEAVALTDGTTQPETVGARVDVPSSSLSSCGCGSGYVLEQCARKMDCAEKMLHEDIKKLSHEERCYKDLVEAARIFRRRNTHVEELNLRNDEIDQFQRDVEERLSEAMQLRDRLIEKAAAMSVEEARVIAVEQSAEEVRKSNLGMEMEMAESAKRRSETERSAEEVVAQLRIVCNEHADLELQLQDVEGQCRKALSDIANAKGALFPLESLQSQMPELLQDVERSEAEALSRKELLQSAAILVESSLQESEEGLYSEGLRTAALHEKEKELRGRAWALKVRVAQQKDEKERVERREEERCLHQQLSERVENEARKRSHLIRSEKDLECRTAALQERQRQWPRKYVKYERYIESLQHIKQELESHLMAVQSELQPDRRNAPPPD